MQQSNLPVPGPDESLVTLAHIIYGLHTLSILIGVSSAATIIGAFVFGIPSIVAVVLNYLRRDDVRGTWLDSHFRWQIRTFWFGLLWIGVAFLLALTIIGIVLVWVPLIGAGIWVIYRILRGWLNLKDRRPLPLPA